MYFQRFFWWLFIAVGVHWLPTYSQFVKQPGDVTVTAIPGYPFDDNIPCILKNSIFQEIGWEQRIDKQQKRTVSSNRIFYYQHASMYAFANNDSCDYSISIIAGPPNKLQVRCYVRDLNADVSYSSWSNITYTGMSDKTFLA